MDGGDGHSPAEWDTWQEYYAAYISARIATMKSLMMLIAAEGMFRDFPRRLPARLRDCLSSRRILEHQPFASGAQQLGLGVTGQSQTEQDEGTWVAPETAELIAGYLVQLCAHTGVTRVPPADLRDFSRHALGQQLIIIFAHLDAFLNATAQMVLTKRPELREPSTGKHGELSEEDQVERQVHRFGMQDIPHRLRELRERFGVDLDAGVAAELLKQASLLRNLFAHTGGIVNRWYLRKSGSKLPLGGRVPLDQEYIEKVMKQVMLLADSVHRSVQRMFGRGPSTLPFGQTTVG